MVHEDGAGEDVEAGNRGQKKRREECRGSGSGQQSKVRS